ncbi:MAG TPA: GH116 family glycosyl-hydrolase, partial [Terriglobales bacterium]|nr:GH116 family glycosyl-hydrolase [Terriglobales bacterium]
MGYRRTGLVAWFFLLAASTLLWAGDSIPKAAWKRPIGEPFQNAGTKKPHLEPTHIDDGYWQGAPVGGFGSGTFSRTYRGDFSRWHIKAGVHKYQTIYSNQFAMYQKAEGSEAVAQALSADHGNGSLGSWKWNYPVGAGDYYSLYPKSWFDYRWDKFPAHVVLEQFSPVLPDNYRESSYPVAVYRWHAENPTQKPVTVSILFSWTNMVGWFRSRSRDFDNRVSASNYNHLASAQSTEGRVLGIVFDRHRTAAVHNDWDGQFAVATVQEPGTDVSYVT